MRDSDVENALCSRSGYTSVVFIQERVERTKRLDLGNQRATGSRRAQSTAADMMVSFMLG